MVMPICDVVLWNVLILGLVTMGKSKSHVIVSTNVIMG
jgi:hypothetical protein